MEKVCKLCNNKFVTKNRTDQVYCSDKCKNRNNYLEHRDYYQNYWLSKPKYSERNPKILCLVCNNEFAPTSSIAKCCSQKCSKKKWKSENREKVNAQNRKDLANMRLRDPERYRFYSKNRRHLIKEASNGVSGKRFSTVFTLKDWEEIKESFENKCAICNCDEKLTIDHIIPLSKGGKHSKENIQPLCHECNSGKKDKLPEELIGTTIS